MHRNDRSKKIEISLEDLNEGASFDQRRDLPSTGQRVKGGQLICPNCGAGIVSSIGNSKILGSVVIFLVTLILISSAYFGYNYFYGPQLIVVPHDYPSIQAAIDAVEQSAVIKVEPGAYYEELDFKGKDIAIQSKGSGSLTIVSSPRASGKLSSLFGDNLINARGEKLDTNILANKIIGVYFSASWCGPCRQFSPLLVETYNELKRQNKPFEIVLVSWDSDEAAMENYMKDYNMAWPAVKYGSEEADNLKEHFQVSGIPYLVILNSSGDVISTNGRSEVANNKATAFDLWAD